MDSVSLDSRREAGAQLILDGENLAFSSYCDDHDDSIDRDLDIHSAELMALTRRGRTFVQQGIDGYSRLRDLPPGTDPDTFAIFDDALVDMFSPAGCANFNPRTRRKRENVTAPTAAMAAFARARDGTCPFPGCHVPATHCQHHHNLKNRTVRARVARFNAQCHALCGIYEADGAFDTCIRKIRALETEYDLFFEFHPQPEDLSWIPPEPRPEEPPHPDPD